MSSINTSDAVPMGAIHAYVITMSPKMFNKWRGCALNFEPLISIHVLLLSHHSGTLFMVSSGSKNLVPWLFPECSQWFSSQGKRSGCALMKASLCRRVWQPYTYIIISVLHSARSSKKVLFTKERILQSSHWSPMVFQVFLVLPS